MLAENSPKVSIIIPLYNQERYFKACIKSVENQSYNNQEVIIVNDGSTDTSPQMANAWGKRDSRVKVINKKNEGTALARRDGCLNATGDYVLFLDSDDLLVPGAIEKMVDCALKTDVDLVIGLHDKWVGRMSTHGKADRNLPFPYDRIVSQPELFDDYYVNFFSSSSHFPVGMWAKLYRKPVIDKAIQETELFTQDVALMGEDLYFNVKLFPYLKSAYRMNESVYRYRYGGGTFRFNKNMPQVLVLCDKRLELLDQFNYAKGYGPLFSEYVAFVYNHASQLIYFNKADRDGVIGFFKHELASRQLVPRLEAFYEAEKNLSDGHRFLLNRDYEAMYEKAKALGQATYGTIKFKIINTMVRVFDSLS